jgi:hypothetical protein
MNLIKNIKILLVLTAVSLFISIGLYFDGKVNKSNNDQEPLIPNFDEILSQIHSIEFKNEAESTIIQDIDEQWLVTSALNLPANTELLSRFFVQIREAKIVSPKTSNPDLFFKLGLDEENSQTLVLKSKSDEILYSLDIGDFNYKIPGTYIKETSSDQSYLISTNLTTDVSSFYWIPNDLINIGKEVIQSIQIYSNQLISLSNKEGLIIHENLPAGFKEISENRLPDVFTTLTDLQHNGYLARNELPSSADLEVRYTLTNGTVLYASFFDIPEKGIHVTFDWNYLNENIEISKFINLDLSGNQLQVSTMSLLDTVAYNIPQLVYDNLNLKLREKTD